MDQARYSATRIRFLGLHLEAILAAYLDPDPRTSRGELERIDWEWRHRPARHLCTCHCPRERGGWAPCRACVAAREAGRNVGVRVAIGRTAPVRAPMPDALVLDLARAMAAGYRRPRAIAAYLNGERAA